ncbi:MAG: hypothetical protein ACKOSQ_09840 [Planctomycetaceae bacterium]
MSPPPAAKTAAETKMPRFHVDATGFQVGEADIQAVCDSAGRELWRHFPDYPLEPMVVVRGKSGPITLFERNARREIVIQLDTSGRLWSQYAYQFAHEFCHVLCGARKGDKSNQWFEETLCEMASLYAMRGMARTWKTSPPYPNWRDYRDSLRDYVDDTMRRWPHVDEIFTLGLPAFYATREAALRKNSTDRELNGSIAVVLLREFEAQPEHWESVRWLNTRRTDAVRTFDAYLTDWHESVPDRHKPFVARIAALFGKRIEDAGKPGS